MFESFKSEEAKSLSAAIDRVSALLATYDTNSEEYANTLSYLERLYALKTETRKYRVSPDSMLIVAGNLLGILIIVAYEQKHVFGSKAISFISKAK